MPNRHQFRLVLVLALTIARAGTAQAPTSTVHLAFLTSGNTYFDIPDGAETPVLQVEVYAPCHPNWNTMPPAWVRPVVGCPLAYKVWEVLVAITPVTVQNLGAVPGTLTVTIYSDNAYVYQQQATVPAGAKVPIYFGTQALGFICSDGGPAMPVQVSMRATGANMRAILDTGVPALLRAPAQGDHPKVYGVSAMLLPLDGGTGVCG